MTDNQNIPPVPPAYPQHPVQPLVQQQPQPPAGYGQPQYQQPYQGQPAYGQAPYQQPPQGQPGYGQNPYPQQVHQQPQQYAPTGQPGNPAVSALHRPSGYRVAAGITTIALGFWMLISSFAGIAGSSSYSYAGLLLMTLVASLGTMAAGIILVIKQRRRSRGLPITLLCVAGVDFLLSFIGIAATAMFIFAVLMAVAVLIVMSIGLARENRGL